MAKEGLPVIAAFIVPTLIAAFVFYRTGSAAAMAALSLCAALTLFVMYFFRDPERTIPAEKGLLVAPADGRVVDISEIHDEYLGGQAKKISIFLSIFDVHVNRIPADGTVQYLKYYKGKFLAAWDHKASLDNEQLHVGLDCGSYKLLIKPIAGLIARRIVWHVREGARVKRGDRFGIIRFGSRTDLHFPASAEVRVKIGDKVKGGSSVLARVN
jgi:phosphatidylserine decarboxylase